MNTQRTQAVVRLERTFNRPTIELVHAVTNGLLEKRVLCDVDEMQMLTSQQPPLFDCMRGALSGVKRIETEIPGAAVYAHVIPIKIELAEPPYFSGDIVVTAARIPSEGHVLHIGSDDSEPLPMNIMAALLEMAGKASAGFAEHRMEICSDSMKLLWVVVKTISRSILGARNGSTPTLHHLN